MKLFKKILIAAGIFLATAGLAVAATVLTVPQGGTGLAAVPPTQVLYGGTASTGPLGISSDFTFNNVTKYLDVNGTIDASVQYNINGLFFGDQDQGNLSVSVGNNAHNVALGARNTVFGNDAANNLTIGNDNTVIGQNAIGDAATSASQNTAVGSSAGRLLSGGTRNVFMGYRAGDAIASGNDNVFIGNAAGLLSNSASGNTAVGSFAMSSAVNAGAANITAIGANALSNTTAQNNTAVGAGSGTVNTGGQQNTFVGALVNTVATVGNDQVAVGYLASVDNRGTAIGSQTTAGDSGIALGHTAQANSGEFALPNTLTNFKFQGDSYVLPVNGSITTAGALTNDGTGVLTWVPSGGGTVTGTGALGQATFWTGANTIAGSNDFLWDNSLKTFAVGDLTSTGNDTSFFVDDVNQAVGAAVVLGGGENLNYLISPAATSMSYDNGLGGQWGFQVTHVGLNNQTQIKSDTSTWVWPQSYSTGTQALVDDGAGNLSWTSVGSGTIGGTIAANQIAFGTGVDTIGGSNDALWDDSAKDFFVGDSGSTANDVALTVSNTNSRIIAQGQQFRVSDPNGDLWAQISPQGQFVDLGDVSLNNNDTHFVIDDTSEVMTGFFDNAFSLRNTSNQTVLSASTLLMRFLMGDVSGAFNDTLLDINDSSRTITMDAVLAGTGGQLFASSTDNHIWHQNGASTWGWGADTTGGGRTYVKANTTTWAWPNSDSTGTQALVSDGAGALSWASLGTGNITGSGTSPRIPYWNSATALIDDASFTRLANRGVVLQDTATNHNVFLGTGVGVASLSGSLNNVGIGNAVLTALTTGDRNIALGDATGDSIQGGSDNILLGQNTGTAITSGSRNIYIGDNSGTVTTTGSDNIVIGSGIGPQNNAFSNTLAFQGAARAANQIVFGNDTGVTFSDMFLGQGVQASGVLGTFTIHGSGKNGFTNETAQNLAFGSQSSGTALPANVFLQTTNSISSGTTQQTLTTVAQTLGLTDYMGFQVNHGLVLTPTILNDADYDASTSANLIAATPNYIFPTLTAPRTFTLPAVANVSWGTEISVCDGKGSAAGNNITIARSSTDLIDGATSYTMSVNYQCNTFLAWGDVGGNYWKVK